MRESVEIENNLKLVSDAETSAALDFHNQLASTQILLGIETGDATYRLQRLQEFLKQEFLRPVPKELVPYPVCR